MYETNVVPGGEQPKHVIVIEGKTYELPLMGDVPYDELDKALEGLDGYKAFLEKHLPKKIVAELSVRQLRAIQTDWGNYSRQDMGITPGES